MARLLMILSAPAQHLPDGRVRLDIKFLEGLKRHRDLWNDEIRCLLWESTSPIPFGRDCTVEDVAVPLEILPAGTPLRPRHLQKTDIILAGADNWMTHGIPDLTEGKVSVVYIVEYTLKTRLDIVRLSRGTSLLKKAHTALWLFRQERQMRRAFRAAAGLQCNGFPAYAAYHGLTPSPMVYLDGRMSRDIFASEPEQQHRRNGLLSGRPLRLVNFGRLEPMKGAQDFLPFAKRLKAKDIPFTLDIFGTGALEHNIRNEIERDGLSDQVALHAPVDFETELVPWMRANADIFLSCHRQDDPSCAYIEAMGCGLAVLGYKNGMLIELARQSQAGRCVDLGDVTALATEAARLSQNRAEVAALSERALAYAKAHDFETEFALRMKHLNALAPG